MAPGADESRYPPHFGVTVPQERGLGPLCQLANRLEIIHDRLSQVRVQLSASMLSLAGSETAADPQQADQPKAPIPNGLVEHLHDRCEGVQAEISRIDVLVQRLGGLL